MGRLFRAIKAENIKLYSKTSSKFYLLTALLLPLVIAFSLGFAGSAEYMPVLSSKLIAVGAYEKYEYDSEWKTQGEAMIAENAAAIKEITDSLDSLTGYGKRAAQRESDLLYREAAVMRYRMDNDYPPEDDSGWYTVLLVMWLSALLMAPLYLVSVSDAFAGEYVRGTVRNIFPRPVTRNKQYAAKLTVCSGYALLLVVVITAASVLSVVMTRGRLGSGRYIGFFQDGILNLSWAQVLLMIAGCLFCSWLVLTSLCALTGMMTCSRAASCAVCTAVLFISFLAGDAICAVGGMIGGLSVFGTLDLTVPYTQTPNYALFGFNTCLLCDIAYFVVFSAAGYNFFKRDV